MVTINRHSKELNRWRDLTKFDNHVRVGGREVYFTSLAAENCEIEPGKFIHFINDDDDWRFYVNKDEDGFVPIPVNSEGVVRQNYRINCVPLVTMILKSFGFKQSKKFSIEKTGAMMGKSPVFKMSLEKIIT